MSQYDEIAREYQRTAENEISRIFVEDPNMLQVIGDMAGLDVLGVGCGDGYLERILKQNGAERVIGTDISDRMLELAVAFEKEEPLGISYRRADLSNMPILGQFHLVTAKFVLNYAENRRHLLHMCEGIIKNVCLGGRLIALVPDYGTNENSLPQDGKYGLTAEPTKLPLVEGDRLKITLTGGQSKVSFTITFWRVSLYVLALERAGFHHVACHRPMPTPEGVRKYGEEFWAEWTAHPYSTIIEAWK